MLSPARTNREVGACLPPCPREGDASLVACLRCRGARARRSRAGGPAGRRRTVGAVRRAVPDQRQRRGDDRRQRPADLPRGRGELPGGPRRNGPAEQQRVRDGRPRRRRRPGHDELLRGRSRGALRRRRAVGRPVLGGPPGCRCQGPGRGGRPQDHAVAGSRRRLPHRHLAGGVRADDQRRSRLPGVRRCHDGCAGRRLRPVLGCRRRGRHRRGSLRRLVARRGPARPDPAAAQSHRLRRVRRRRAGQSADGGHQRLPRAADGHRRRADSGWWPTRATTPRPGTPRR